MQEMTETKDSDNKNEYGDKKESSDKNNKTLDVKKNVNLGCINLDNQQILLHSTKEIKRRLKT